MTTSPAADALRTCLREGATEFVICGGARNLEPVALLAKQGPPVRCWNFPEERSAAFFALGRARASAKPVVVLTTSGTAADNC